MRAQPKVSYLKVLGFILAVMTPFSAIVARPVFTFAADDGTEPAAISYIDGANNFVVTADNTRILRVEALSATTESVCTKDSPCLYDDLPYGIAPFVLSGGSWPVTGFTYSFGNDSPDIAFSSERGIIGQAFGLWSNVTNIKPSEVADGGNGSCTGNIRIWWASGAHGDPFPFDGPGGVLAHTFYPPPINVGCIAGDVHFDEAENWVSPTYGGVGIDLMTVAAHELGHSLGLGHSTDPNALMYPFYTGRRAYISSDDIAGIRAIYGNRTDDIIFQLESLTTIPPGGGSFKLVEGSVSVQLRQKGTTNFFIRTLPFATTDVGGSLADVDGVLARNAFGTQFDGFWWHVGDLYRAQFLLGNAYKDIDQVKVTLNISNNTLTSNETLRVSINGIILGYIVVSPGNVVKVATFATNFVNPIQNTVDVGSHYYNLGKH